MGIETLLFGAVFIMAIAFAVGMLTTDNAVHSALCLIANFGCVAFLFLMLDAPFLSMVQIAVYAGAIMVLFLFVIMLLKAEQGSDTTTRRFPWLPITATILGVLLLVVIGGPLVLNGFNLPERDVPAPTVRVVNASVLSATDVTISGPTLTTPLVINGLTADDPSDFQTLPAGAYSITLLNSETGSTVGAGRLTLNDGDVITLVASGEFDQDVGRLVSITPVRSDFDEAGSNNGRLVLFNGVSETPVSLVNLGDDATPTIVTRDGADVLIDPIIAPTAPYLSEAVVVNYPKGTYNLALVDPAFNVIERLSEYTVRVDTETLLLYVPESSGSDSGMIRAVTMNTAAPFGSPKGIGRMLFTDYLLPVNLVGMLLLVALVGVIVLSRHESEKSERRSNVRRKVSRPLVNVISTQTGSDVAGEAPQLPTGDS